MDLSPSALRGEGCGKHQVGLGPSESGAVEGSPKQAKTED